MEHKCSHRANGLEFTKKSSHFRRHHVRTKLLSRKRQFVSHIVFRIVSRQQSSIRRIAVTSLFGITACATTPKVPPPPQLPIVEFITDAGTIRLEIDSVRAPKTAANFLRYIDRGMFDSARFTRVVAARNEIGGRRHLIQATRPDFLSPADDPPVELEPTSETGIQHKVGTVSMARSRAANSATSSFFILLEDDPPLDFGGSASGDGKGYAAFGRVVQGIEIVQKIHTGRVRGDQLIIPIIIQSAKRVRNR